MTDPSDIARVFREVLDHHVQTPNGTMIYLGIDPGMSGAVGLLVKGRAFVADIPSTMVAKSGRGRNKRKSVYVLPPIAAALRMLRPVRSFVRAVIEEAQSAGAGGGQNAFTALQTGIGYGMWMLALATVGVAYETVHPSRWKSEFKLIRQDKEVSRVRAMAMFPNAPLSRKKDHNRAEALLLAEWHRRHCEGDS